MFATVAQWLDALEEQRRALKMSFDVLADLAGLSRATVCRMLIQKRPSSHLDNVFAIAHVLGATPELRVADAGDLVERQVQKQAQEVVQMVQGTMALEAQGITDPSHQKELVELAAQAIRKKPRKKLWVKKCRSAIAAPAKPQSRTFRS